MDYNKGVKNPHYVTCAYCGKQYKMMISLESYTAWKQGQYIQVAFPYLNADERELLMSRMCGTCWNQTFSPDET